MRHDHRQRRLGANIGPGLPAFHSTVAAAAPFLASSLASLTDWDQIKLLSVRANRLRRWSLPGLLYIGDATHVMSLVGGIGVNYATADAVAAANSLAGPLANGAVSDDNLRAVQRRREPPTRVAQWLQGLQTANLVRMSRKGPRCGCFTPQRTTNGHDGAWMASASTQRIARTDCSRSPVSSLVTTVDSLANGIGVVSLGGRILVGTGGQGGGKVVKDPHHLIVDPTIVYRVVPQ